MIRSSLNELKGANTWQKLIGWFDEAAAGAYQAVEYLNRSTHFLAMLDRGLNRGLTATEAVKQALTEMLHGQFVYGRLGAPTIFRTPLGFMTFGMYSYPIRYIEYLISLAQTKGIAPLVEQGLVLLAIDQLVTPSLRQDEVTRKFQKELLGGKGDWLSIQYLLLGTGARAGISDFLLPESIVPFDIGMEGYDPLQKPIPELFTNLWRALQGDERAKQQLALMDNSLRSPVEKIADSYWFRNFIPFGGQIAQFIEGFIRGMDNDPPTLEYVSRSGNVISIPIDNYSHLLEAFFFFFSERAQYRSVRRIRAYATSQRSKALNSLKRQYIDWLTAPEEEKPEKLEKMLKFYERRKTLYQMGEIGGLREEDLDYILKSPEVNIIYIDEELKKIPDGDPSKELLISKRKEWEEQIAKRQRSAIPVSQRPGVLEWAERVGARGVFYGD